jgi:hypothetical protein
MRIRGNMDACVAENGFVGALYSFFKSREDYTIALKSLDLSAPRVRFLTPFCFFFL